MTIACTEQIAVIAKPTNQGVIALATPQSIVAIVARDDVIAAVSNAKTVGLPSQRQVFKIGAQCVITRGAFNGIGALVCEFIDLVTLVIKSFVEWLFERDQKAAAALPPENFKVTP